MVEQTGKNIDKKDARELLKKIVEDESDNKFDFLLIKNRLGEVLKQKLFSKEIDIGLAYEVAVYINKTFQKQVSWKKIKEELIKLNQIFPQLSLQLSDFSYE